QEAVSAQFDQGASETASPSAATPRAKVGRASCPPGTPPQGLEVWRRRVADDDILQMTSVATDGNDNAYAARAAGGMSKVSETGDALWSKSFGSLVASNGSGDNVVVAGTFSEGPGSEAPNGLPSAGGTDVFVAKLDSSGNVLYAVAFGGPGAERAEGLAVDMEGSAVVSGPGIGTIKLDGAGHVVWTQSFHGAVTTDSAGNVIVTGGFTRTATFGGDPLVSAGGEDVFVAKVDISGNLVFSRRYGDAGNTQRGGAVAVDSFDNILVGGVAEGSIDFGGGPLSVRPGTCPAESWCKQAGFVLKLDPSGHHVFSRSVAPVRSIEGIATDSMNRVFASGAEPGDATPYRTLLLLELDSEGNDLGLSARLAADLTESGAGHGVTVDRCDSVLWAFSVPLGANELERSFITKLAP
ncbi:MAG TPA: hypothetical protein VF395_02770, partial [Polyangiaceae bacterium]